MGFPMSSPCYLAIDAGTHAIKTAVYDTRGTVLDKQTFPLHLQRIAGEDACSSNGVHIEQAPKEILAALNQALQAIPKDLFDRLKSVGLAVQRSSVLAWDKRTGEALSAVLSWQDTRSQPVIDLLGAHANQIVDKTGLKLSAHYGASKLQYLSQRYSGVGVCLSPLSSYLTYHLTEDRLVCCDESNAQRTMLWNVHDRCWDSTLLSLFELEPTVLPEVVPVHYSYGRVSSEYGGKCAAEITVVIGDQNAIGSYLLNAPSDYAVNVGTGAFVLCSQASHLQDSNNFLKTLVNSHQGSCNFVLEGTVNGAGAALSWFANNVAVENDLDEGELITSLGGWLTDGSPCETIFLNTIGGLGSPFWKPGPSPAFLPENAALKDKAIAVIESIVFLLAINIRGMANQKNNTGQIYLSGGLSRYDGLCQKLADLSRLPVVQMHDCESTLIGTACLASKNQIPRGFEGKIFTSHQNVQLEKRFSRFCLRIESSYQIVAHRGYASEYPENSLPAFLACFEQGVNTFECDIQLTKDKLPVVFHDADLQRITGSSDLLSGLNYQELLAFSVHEPLRFNNKFKPTQIPTLSEVLQLLKANVLATGFIEIKNDIFETCSREAFLKLVHRQLESVASQVFIISYDLEFLRRVQSDSRLRVGWVLSEYDEFSRCSVQDRPVDILISNIDRLPENKEDLWDGPWDWFAYEIADRSRLEKCLALGIFWIEGRNPVLLKELLNNE